jgi:hypothetical protein
MIGRDVISKPINYAIHNIGSGWLDRLRGIAAGHEIGGGGAGAHGGGGGKASVAQAAIAWLLAKKAVSSVIVGASKLHQLEDNLAAADLRLSAEEVAALDEQTKPAAVYPNWFSELVVDGPVKEAFEMKKAARNFRAASNIY